MHIMWRLSTLLFMLYSLSADSSYPQGYYAFESAPWRRPPTVRKPPYLQTSSSCAALNTVDTLDNLCGDLNTGFLPLNPMGQNVHGVSYPFELLKQRALAFFSNTLPVLKRDETLPKVARFADHIVNNNNNNNLMINGHSDLSHHRRRRSSSESSRGENKGWCEDSYGVFCLLLNALRDSLATSSSSKMSSARMGDADLPMTPCPSVVEYVTPVFAKNYENVWRYVVQIPYEGYFTQTVEVVKCLSNKCAYLEGSCLASPRWLSLLVAEIFYPQATFPGPMKKGQRQPVKGVSPPNQSSFLKKRQIYLDSNLEKEEEEECDGHDELGCYQVRLYYDWFLIPGSCKCWKKDVFQQFSKK